MPITPTVPCLTLFLTGPFTARDADGSEVEGLSRRAQALLAYLSQQPDMKAERARLADLLWSDRGEEQARASLRQELSVLRKLLPDGLVDADRQVVRLDPAAVRVDTSRPGAFLDGFDLPSEGFEDWLRECRARIDAPAPRPARAQAKGGRPTLAVLPFDYLAATPGDMLADGIVDEITGALSRVRDFDVIARQSAFALRGSRPDIPTAAKALGATYLVEGTVKRAGERVRITIDLVGADGRSLWSRRFDDRLDDLFDLQDRIAAQVAGQLAPSLRNVEITRARSRPLEDRTAYDLFLTGLPHFWSHQREGMRAALACFDAAIARQPDFAEALAMKGWSHAHLCSYGWSTDVPHDRKVAVENANAAAALASDHAPTLVAIAATITLSTLERDRAQRLIDRALELDPNNAWGWMRNGWLHSLYNMTDHALDHFARAETLSPLDPFRFNIEFGKANSLAQLGRMEEAVAHIRAGLAMAPGVTWAYRMLASYAGILGDMETAREAAGIFLGHYPGMTISKMREGMPPSIFETQPVYLEGMRLAGIPEE